MKMTMKISNRVKESVAHAIGEYFSTKEITTVFSDFDIETDESLYAKWRITLDAFAKAPNTNTEIPELIAEFCHPLNFKGEQRAVSREAFIGRLNEILSYDDIEVEYTDKTATLVPASTDEPEEKPKPEKVSKGSPVPKNEEGVFDAPKADDLPDVNKCSISSKAISLIAGELPLQRYEVIRIIEPILKEIKYIYPLSVVQDYLDRSQEYTFFDLNDVLQTMRQKDISADRHIARVLSALLQPINYEPYLENLDQFKEKIDRFLAYDKLTLIETDGTYTIEPIPKEINRKVKKPKQTEAEIIQSLADSLKEDDPIIIKNKGRLMKIREYHQAYMHIIEMFCEDTTKPDPEVNDAYVKLANKIQLLLNSIPLKRHKIEFYRPFEDLYSAEHDWQSLIHTDLNGDRATLSWDAIRPRLYKAHSDISKLISKAETTPDMTDDEVALEAINSLIANKRTATDEPDNKYDDIPAMRLIHENADTKTSKKKAKKQSTYPKTIPSGTRWESITMRFLDDETVEIQVAGTVHKTGYADMGFADNRKNGQPPNLQWMFLKALAENNGSLKASDGNASDNYKQHKLRLSKRLMEYFSLDTEPFKEYTTQTGYKLKMTIFYNKDVDKQPTKPQQDTLSEEVGDIFSDLAR
ncbi:hypothetical protein H6787_02165 [Candidatus Nomurabacteria bacterium]|nr:hypothetical protein [Candidatus Nomurabacteria bacterium]